ncbi:MAG: endonuclease/exonuclease/phosphatase family protein [Bacteroidales bacterium]|nr:endonuclease/exonuclease/phosphatase family protein [Bacteroidales bacterium]
MKKSVRRVIRISIWSVSSIILLILAYFITVIAIATSNDYKPPMSDTLNIVEGNNQFLFPDEEVSIITWNIGYCGLGQEMDFFYEGGKNMGPNKELYQQYINSVFKMVSGMDSVDFVLLQEVDFGAKRTYNDHQDSVFMKALSEFSFASAANYKVPYIPFPIFNPMGRVNSGVMSFSRFIPDYAARIQYPGSYEWPMKVFFLDRCFIIMKFDLENGKEFILVNTHNSAYSDAADIRLTEMQFLKSFLLDWASRGNYVMVGGDWNANPPGFDTLAINNGDKVYFAGQSVDSDFMPQGWQWVYDPSMPTNRDVASPYFKGQTKTTLIDYFLCSPNIEVHKVKTLDEGFAVSDHNPVYLNVTFLPDTPCCDSVAVYEFMKEEMKKKKKK